MEIKELRLSGLKLITPRLFRDDRGFFMETYDHKRYDELGSFVQDNHSYSKRGVVRGMHYQEEPGQAKLVRVVLGKIYDVVVDIRPDSPTFGEWEGIYLDDQLHQQLYVPVGFAHGFQVVSDHAHVCYKVSSLYNAETEKGFRFDDPSVGIKWPEEALIISEQDQKAPFFNIAVKT